MTITKSGNGYIVSEVLRKENTNFSRACMHSKYYKGYTHDQAKAKFMLDYPLTMSHLTASNTSPNVNEITA